jgi:hypothetical protein
VTLSRDPALQAELRDTRNVTFGVLLVTWVHIILQTRAMRAMEFEQASAILQKGLELNWTSAQYLEMLGDKTDSGPFISIRSALAANQRNGEKPKILRNMMQRLLDTFVQRANRIRLAKPAANTPLPD